MRIGINAAWLGDQTGGIGTYVRNLVAGLAAVDPRGDYVLYAQAPLPTDMPLGTAHMRRVVVGGRLGPLRLPFATSLALAHAHVDVVHEQIVAPLVFPARIVVTIHDLLHEHYPQFYAPDVLQRMRTQTPLTIRRAAVVLTDSEFSKQDIVRRYTVSPDKIVVAHLAADPAFRPLHDEARVSTVRERYGTTAHFILCVGALRPNKNLGALVEAYRRLRQAHATQHRLVFVGASVEWLQDEIFAAVRGSGYDKEIIFTGHVTQLDLVALYNAADAFVHPSLYEGFGLPPLEAMACGTPVIASNASSLPEVLGAAALLVDPHDIDGLARTIVQVLNDPELQARLSAAGLARAAAFSWEATARTVLSAYYRAASPTRHAPGVSRLGS